MNKSNPLRAQWVPAPASEGGAITPLPRVPTGRGEGLGVGLSNQPEYM